MDSKALQTLVAENQELEKKLTKKNEQYIFDLKKALTAANCSEEEQAQALFEILPQLIAEQKAGNTARQLFGTVSERTEAILSKPKPQPETEPFLMWLDNTMLLFGWMTIGFSLMSLWSKGKNQSIGILTLLIGALAGGYVFYLMYKYVYQYDSPNTDRSKRPGWFKTGLILAASMLVWIAIFTASAMVPSVINPVLDPIVVIVIGGITIGVRYLLKKKYNMRSSLLR